MTTPRHYFVPRAAPASLQPRCVATIRRSVTRKCDTDARSGTRKRPKLHETTVPLDDRRHDSEPESGTATDPLAARVGPVQPLEDPPGLFAGHPGPGVADLEHGGRPGRQGTHG